MAIFFFNYKEKTLDNVAQKYGFTQRKALLRTSMPYITVNSEEELESVLSSLNNFVDELNSENQALDFDNENARATKLAKFSKGLGFTIGNWSTAKFNVFSSLEVSNKKITKVNYSDQSLTGFTLGISLTKGSTSCKVSTDKTKATVKGTGTINANILFEGIGTIFSKDYTVSGTYTAS